MSAYHLRNIPLSTLIWFLEKLDLKCINKDKGHFKYSRKDLARPIVFQTHIDPVPEFIVKQILRTLKFSPQQFHEFVEKYK